MLCYRGSHSHGARKRHNYKRIVVEKEYSMAAELNDKQFKIKRRNTDIFQRREKDELINDKGVDKLVYKD